MKSVGEPWPSDARSPRRSARRCVRWRTGGEACADGEDVFDEHRFDHFLTTRASSGPFYIAEALRRGYSVDALAALTHIDRVLNQLQRSCRRAFARGVGWATSPLPEMREAKQHASRTYRSRTLPVRLEPSVDNADFRPRVTATSSSYTARRSQPRRPTTTRRTRRRARWRVGPIQGV